MKHRKQKSAAASSSTPLSLLIASFACTYVRVVCLKNLAIVSGDSEQPCVSPSAAAPGLNAGHALLCKIEQLELDFGRLLSLFLDVSEDGVFRSSIAHRADVVAIRPERSSPQLLFDGWDFETGSGCEFLDHADDAASRMRGKELAEDMDVVFIEPGFVDVNGKALFESFECFQNRLDHMRFQDRSPVFDRDLDVIVALGDVVIPTPEVRVDLGHRPSIAGCC
jgi:hypothetical protein